MMTDSVASRVPASAQEAPALPPLRIHHFLVWTAVLAATLALLSRTGVDRERSYLPPPVAGWAFVAFLVVPVVSICAATTCLGFGIAWRRRGLNFPSEPGQWFVVQTGLEGIATFVLLTLFAIFWPGTKLAEFSATAPRWMERAFLFSVVVGESAFCLLSLATAIWWVQGWRWRLVFAIAAWMYGGWAAIQAFISYVIEWGGAYIDAIAHYMSLGIDAIPTLLLLMLILMGVATDWRKHVHRHWSHWLGVGVWGINAAMKSIGFIVAWWSWM